jgi:hypothetical protein
MVILWKNNFEYNDPRLLLDKQRHLLLYLKPHDWILKETEKCFNFFIQKFTNDVLSLNLLVLQILPTKNNLRSLMKNFFFFGQNYRCFLTYIFFFLKNNESWINVLNKKGQNRKLNNITSFWKSYIAMMAGN